MKKLVLFAAIAAVFSLSACKKAAQEAPVQDEAVPVVLEDVEGAVDVEEAPAEEVAE
jgi:hypothetical protein